MSTCIIQVNHPLLTVPTEAQQLRQVITLPGAHACAQQKLEHNSSHGQHESDTTRQPPFFVTRKVSSSGHITYRNRFYFVSKRLAGQLVPVRIEATRLIVTATFTVHKELSV